MPSHVYKDITFIGGGTDTIQIGNMNINSISGFSAVLSSGKTIVLKWTNPLKIQGKPYSGVIINYSTSEYPSTGGTQIYKGTGNSTIAGAQSQTTVTLPSLGTLYYFSCIPYANTSLGELKGSILNASASTASIINKTFTGSTTYSIPSGYTNLDIFCVGGGGGGAYGDNSSKEYSGGGGAGSGYTKTVKSIPVSSGQTLAITVGNGAASGRGISAYGSASSVSRSGTVLCSANGGQCGGFSSGNGYLAGNGGSGGGHGGESSVTPGSGGYDGSDAISSNPYADGKGQGTTTRAFGQSSGTLYAGAGGGGGFGNGNGGSGGGGRGGNWNEVGTAGSASTGGGGGGGGYHGAAGGNGGSGIILIKLY